MAVTRVISTESDRKQLCRWAYNAPLHTVVTFKKPGRTIPQNDRMWAMLTDVATQAEHKGKKYTPEQWKCLFMHACGYEANFMEGLNGEPFPAGFRSSNLNKGQFADLIEFISAWGAQNGVRFKDE